ncbi:hypothetical protein CEUSTIGMA_g8585.t1 [Chlamydomonas eustigma]|uniref:Uncharacterized protein n=1 Tax=Chlamydomonas eustigma TaxID=1157962 RepID=A0A250XE27_9CHLO|nr:hypothetical protein CEUSTIGMA_g8585.t1 [Chlamydomonas eustigma]|eukprot:GAX81152.1 hypothetical protein CEUSTIGMA_g8585.t1 [Chlamydomonas eustigma]
MMLLRKIELSKVSIPSGVVKTYKARPTLLHSRIAPVPNILYFGNFYHQSGRSRTAVKGNSNDEKSEARITAQSGSSASELSSAAVVSSSNSLGAETLTTGISASESTTGETSRSSEQQPEASPTQVVEATSLQEHQQLHNEEGTEHRGDSLGEEEWDPDYEYEGEYYIDEERLKDHQLALALVEELLPEPTEAVLATVHNGYVALAAVHLIQAGLLVMGAFTQSPILFSSVSASHHVGTNTVVLGCLAAASVRTAAQIIFMIDCVKLGEICTWRLQRMNLLLGLTELGTAGCAVVAAANGSTPVVLSMALGIVSLPAAALYLYAMKESHVCGGFFSWTIDWSSPGVMFQNLFQCLRRDLSTLPGWILISMGALALVGTCGLFTTSDPTGGATMSALRAAASFGFLQLTLTAHTLLDFAQNAVPAQSAGAYFKDVFRMEAQSLTRLHEAINPPPRRFIWLNAGMCVSALIQSAALLMVQNLGVDVNTDAYLWGPIYGCTALGLMYSATVAMSMNWVHLFEAAQLLLYTLMRGVVWFVDTFLYRWEFQKGAR